MAIEWEPTTEAPVADVLTGVQLAEPGRCRCQACGDRLDDGQAVRIEAHSLQDGSGWTAPRVWCVDCGPERIEHPTKGADEALATGWLATRVGAAGLSARLTLANVQVEYYSSRQQGYCA